MTLGVMVTLACGACGDDDVQPVSDGSVAQCPPWVPAGSGGGCEYRTFPGTARITMLAPPSPEEPADCTVDPIAVTFDFEPSSADATACYSGPATRDMAQRFAVLSQECITSLGLAVGDEFAATRMDIRPGTGSCSPVIFEIPGIDSSSCTPPPSTCD